MGLSIIMGNMFSGKTSELIRRLKRLKVINKQIIVVNSAKDTRSPEEVLKTHDNVKFKCFKVYDLYDLMDKNVFDVILNMLASGIEASIQTTDITVKTVNIPIAEATWRYTRIADRISVYG